MKSTFYRLLQTRKNILALYEKHEDVAFTIPKGFKNHLYWNLAHCVVTQQILCYKLSNNDMLLENEFIDAYKKGTVPTSEVIPEFEVLKTKELLFTTLEQLEKDYQLGLFSNFNAYSTSYGLQLNNFEDAIQFNTIHEALHLGYMMAMVK
tara:strand:+ start:1169 stop:1618 length:450 start_codon:yes stop_codon:yes gene_type:complete